MAHESSVFTPCVKFLPLETIWLSLCRVLPLDAAAILLWDYSSSCHEALCWIAAAALVDWRAIIYDNIEKTLTTSKTQSNSVTKSLLILNCLFNLSPSTILHHSLNLKFDSTDSLHLACSNRILLGGTYVPAFLMSEKLQKVILTDSGTKGVMPLDARMPMIQEAAS